MSELVAYAKPKMIVLEEKKKLREYQEANLNTLCKELVVYLLNLLAVNGDKTDQHNAMFSFVRDCYKHSTFEEIKYAFNLYVQGEFELKPYQTLNAVVFGQVMREYDLKKKKDLKNYRLNIQQFKNKAKEMTPEEAEEYMVIAIDKAIEVYKKSGKIKTPSSKYDYLDKKGLLQEAFKIDNEKWDAYKKTKYTMVQVELIEQYKSKKAVNRDDKIDIKNTLIALENEKNGQVISECKKQILTDYFEIKIL